MINQTEQNLIENWVWEKFEAINYTNGEIPCTDYWFDINSNQMYFCQDNQNFSDYPDLEIDFEEDNWKLIIKNHTNYYWGIDCKLEYNIPKNLNNLFRIIISCYGSGFPQEVPIVNLQCYYDRIINEYDDISFGYTPSSGIAQICVRTYSDKENNIYTDSEIKSIPYHTPKDILDWIINYPGIDYGTTLFFQKIDNHYHFEFLDDDLIKYLIVKF